MQTLYGFSKLIVDTSRDTVKVRGHLPLIRVITKSRLRKNFLKYLGNYTFCQQLARFSRVCSFQVMAWPRGVQSYHQTLTSKYIKI